MMADYQSFDGHGVDVAVNRADDLDKKSLGYIAEHLGCHVLDVGSGAGGQSIRMAEVGANVVAVDQFDFSEKFSKYEKDNLRFVLGDIVNLRQLLTEEKFDIAICQRTIHYLQYDAAVASLTALRSFVSDKLFISVTGTGSLVGDTYFAANKPLPDRFAELAPLGKEMFQINESVCLYNEVEFRQLLTAAGWRVDECWASAFGNIKAICSNTTS